jgi:hypothetical protein
MDKYILNNLLSELPARDQLKCREVCREWNQLIEAEGGLIDLLFDKIKLDTQVNFTKTEKVKWIGSWGPYYDRGFLPNTINSSQAVLHSLNDGVLDGACLLMFDHSNEILPMRWSKTYQNVQSQCDVTAVKEICLLEKDGIFLNNQFLTSSKDAV